LEYDDQYYCPQSYCCFIRELVNPAAVYSAVEQNRLAKAKLSDKTVFIRTEEAALANSTLLKLCILNLKC
jgi:hypothetical protein